MGVAQEPGLQAVQELQVALEQEVALELEVALEHLLGLVPFLASAPDQVQVQEDYVPEQKREHGQEAGLDVAAVEGHHVVRRVRDPRPAAHPPFPPPPPSAAPRPTADTCTTSIVRGRDSRIPFGTGMSCGSNQC